MARSRRAPPSEGKSGDASRRRARPGDSIWLDFDPQAGHEKSGRRPAVILSPASYNAKLGLALYCPVTSRAKGYPFEVVLPGGLPISGVVLADQIKCQDWRARNAQ